MITSTVMPVSGYSNPRLEIASALQKWKVKMKTLIQKTRYFRLIGSKVVIGLIFASAISVLFISSALADHDNGRG